MEQERKSIQFQITLAGGIDDQNDSEETIFDIITFEDNLLRSVHETIMKILSVTAEKESQISYFVADDTKESLNLDMSLNELQLTNGSTLYAETNKKRKRTRRNQNENMEETWKDTLMITCSTRIFENEGIPIRKARIFVKKNHTCANLIEDICTLWNRTGLKFRYGRNLLNAEKTFLDLGVKGDTEIIVTGGRI